MTLRNAICIACAALFLAAPKGAYGQDVELESVAKISSFKQDLAVPDSPAFVALGLNPEEVARPATVHEFATSVLSGLDKNGNFQAGFALDFAPYLMIKGDDLTITDYRDSYGKQFGAGFQVSLATTKGTATADQSLRTALGFRFPFWNRGDPRKDKKLEACLNGSPAMPARPTSWPEDGREQAKQDWIHRLENEWVPEVEQWVGQCLKTSEERLWNASAFDIGAAPTLIQEGGSVSNIAWGGATFWASLAYGFDKHRRWEWREDKKPQDDALEAKDDSSWAAKKSQLILHVRFRLDEMDPVAQNVFVKQNSLLVGTRWRAGKPALAFSLEASYVYEKPEGVSSTSSFRGAANTDIKIYKQTWLLLALGVSATRDNTTLQLGAGFKWGGLQVDLAEFPQVQMAQAEAEGVQ